MAPKGYKPKGKAKGKGKGKGKAKAKARLMAAAVAAPAGEATALAPGATEAEVIEGEVAAEGGEAVVGEGAIVPVAKAKSKGLAGIRKLVLGSLGEQPIEEAMAEAKKKLQKEDAMIAEARALEAAQDKQVEEALKEFETVKTEVAAAMEKEQTYLKKWNDMKAKKAEASATVNSKRGELLEAQKKLAMLEVTALNHARMQELELKKKEAMEAAIALKNVVLEQKQKQKEALEATKRQLKEQKEALAGKRKAEDEPAEATPAKQVAAQDVE